MYIASLLAHTQDNESQHIHRHHFCAHHIYATESRSTLIPLIYLYARDLTVWNGPAYCILTCHNSHPHHEFPSCVYLGIEGGGGAVGCSSSFRRLNFLATYLDQSAILPDFFQT